MTYNNLMRYINAKNSQEAIKLIEQTELSELIQYNKTAIYWDLAPFTRCARLGLTKVMKAFLIKGVNIDIQNKSGYTALQSVCNNGNIESAKFLIEHNANFVDKFGGYSAMYWAVYYGRINIVKLLITKGVDLYEPVDSNGYNPMFYAIYRGYQKIVKCLLVSGVDPYECTYKKLGHNAFQFSYYEKQTNYIQILKAFKLINMSKSEYKYITHKKYLSNKKVILQKFQKDISALKDKKNTLDKLKDTQDKSKKVEDEVFKGSMDIKNLNLEKNKLLNDIETVDLSINNLQNKLSQSNNLKKNYNEFIDNFDILLQEFDVTKDNKVNTQDILLNDNNLKIDLSGNSDNNIQESTEFSC